ncbi:5-formyltetrahydrofolate cyclo-ligase [Maribacter sp. 2307ULW6-5]|uniref:5-formyltetrahydrofolate cyclo-ligase n=1 Tax=Maribacter sp. 2307ULW6-5 TaxID=3386275 RepID=UPI0039BC61BE
MLKKDLRTKYMALRQEHSKAYIVSQSLAMSNKALGLDIWQGHYYHIFLSIPSKNEPDTAYLLSILQGKDKDVVVPKMEGNELEHYLLTDNTLLKANPWGVPEPQNGLRVTAQQLDVVFVPLLAFDQKGHRVGYGKGFYDRFLKACRKDVIKVGLSLYPPEKAITDSNAEDVRLDFCVTPEKIYTFPPSGASAS